jgi:hypothetical protein
MVSVSFINAFSNIGWSNSPYGFLMLIHIIVFSGHIPKICCCFFFTKVAVAVLFQLTFVSDEVLPPKLSYNYTFGERTYTLYTNSFLNFGQVSFISTDSSTLYNLVNPTID